MSSACPGTARFPRQCGSDVHERRGAGAAAALTKWGVLASEVAPLVAPMLLLVKEAAATDPELLGLLEDSDAQRLTRMRHNAQVLADRGFLSADVSVKHAADVMWTLSAPELYGLLVVRRGLKCRSLR